MTWPCLSCGSNVDIALDACNSCGAGFLSGSDEALAFRLPGVGDVTRMSQGGRLVVAAGAGLALCVVFVLLLLILGKVF